MDDDNYTLIFDTGAQSPLSFIVTHTDVRTKPWPDGNPRISVFQDESDTFYGSNLSIEEARLLGNWLIGVIYQLEH